MKARLSPLLLKDFAIINCDFKFIPSPKDIDFRKLVSEYMIDLDFAIDTNKGITRVFIKAGINKGEKKLPGYSIFAEGAAFFELSEDDTLSEDDKKSLLGYSAISIALNSLRGFIITLTANAPLGKYIFPSIDVNKLFRDKINLTTKKKKTEQKPTPKREKTI